MAKRTKRKRVIRANASPAVQSSRIFSARSTMVRFVSASWLPLLLAVVAFLTYWPSLDSDFIYDARYEIFDEGFITNLANLPAVLSLKVLGMNILLGDRPGQILYLMLNAALWGKEPWGYHLSSNLLHAANVALLFVFLRRLVAMERGEQTGNNRLKVSIALVVVTLIYALHPIATETVAAVNYSSDLLVAFFTLATLLTATAFRGENARAAWLLGGLGSLCAFAALACKESGLAAACLLVVYWFLFCFRQARGPWLLFIGTAVGTSAAFLSARFYLAPPAPGLTPLTWLGGSFFQVLVIQPRLWVFMMGQLAWPTHLSADYTLENVAGLSTPVAFLILLLVLLFQAWLAVKSRIGALGVATYWLGLATVSNFVPLYRILADRFYYLPLAGVSMQLLALLLMTLRSRPGFWMAAALLGGTLVPLTWLTLSREEVFADEFSLWSDTVQVSPYSSNAHCDLAVALSDRGRVDEAIQQVQEALKIAPNDPDNHNNLGRYFAQKGQMDEAIAQFQKALEIDPDMAKAHDNFGCALLVKGQVDEAIGELQKALQINPNYADGHFNLGLAYIRKGAVERAIEQFQETLQLNPDDSGARTELAKAQAELQHRVAPKRGQ